MTFMKITQKRGGEKLLAAQPGQNACGYDLLALVYFENILDEQKT